MSARYAPRRGRRRQQNYRRPWLKYLSRIGLGILVIVVFLTLVQCSVKKPEAPTWTTNFALPVINRTYGMEELISKMDQDEIFVDSLGDVVMAMSTNLDTVALGEERLVADDMGCSFSRTLGAINIQPPDIDPVRVSFGSISGLSGALVGNFLPPVNFSVTTYMPPAETFTLASISHGSVDCVVTNDLGVSLNRVVVSLYDVAANPPELLATDTFPNTIAADGGTDTLPIDLSEVTLSNELAVVAGCHTYGGFINDPPSRWFQTELVFQDGLEASAATAIVDSIAPVDFADTVDLALGVEGTIDTVFLEGGTLSLTLRNETFLPATFSIEIPGLLAGTPCHVDTVLSAGASAVLVRPLDGYRVVPTGNQLAIAATASVPGSDGEMITIDQGNGFDVDVSINDLVIASVVGTFVDAQAAFNEQQDLDIPEGFDDLGLNGAVMTLTVANAVDLPGALDITLVGSNGKTAHLNGEIAPRGDLEIRQTTLVYDQVDDFLSPLPKTVTVSGQIVFGGGGYQGTITHDDWVTATVDVRSPMDLRINNVLIDDIDLQKESINQDDIKVITDHLMNANLNYTITSHLPVGVEVSLLLSGDSASLFADNPQQQAHQVVSVQPMEVEPAAVSLATGTGVVEQPIISTGAINLTHDDVQVLRNDTLYVRNLLILNGADTSGVRFTTNDYITITANIEIEYQFDGDF